jgi:DnaA family protein
MIDTPAKQLVLNISLDDELTFSNFFVARDSSNHEAIGALESMLGDGEPFVYLWGPAGAGLSHLLQATCHAAAERGLTSQYLPLGDLAGFSPDQLFEGLETLDLLCLDGLEHVMGQVGWDEAMFHLYNRLRENRCRLLVAANCPPRELDSRLPDLSSRLAWGVIYRIDALDDEGKVQALVKRAGGRGLELPEEAARFILNHGSRQMDDLLECVDRLDRQSLEEQRKLTIPFIKKVLGW